MASTFNEGLTLWLPLTKHADETEGKMHCLHLLWVNRRNWDEMDWDEWFNVRLFWSLSCNRTVQSTTNLNSHFGHKIIKYTVYICAVLSVLKRERDLSRLLRLTDRVESPVPCFVWLLTSKISFLFFTWMFVLCYHRDLQEGTQSLSNGTQHSIDRGTRETAGERQKRMRVERDRWMEEAEREDCEGGTDGGKKVTAAKKETEDREKREMS